MFLPHLAAGRLSVVAAPTPALRPLHHALVHEALVADPGPVFFLDGASTFSVVQFTEYLLRLGAGFELAQDRVHTHRALTPFNWVDMLTDRLEDGLRLHGPSLVVAGFFNTQFEKEDDLRDWEQERYVEETLQLVRRLAERHRARIVLTLDLARWTRTHPILADILRRQVSVLLHAAVDPRGWSLYAARGEALFEPAPSRETLDAWLPEPIVAVARPRRRTRVRGLLG